MKHGGAEHGRYDYLDGLRGLAAVQVLLSHCLAAFFPSHAGALGFFADGDFAVLLFFVMSGFVLTFSFERGPDAVVGNALGRLIRLGVPLAAISALAFAALSLLPDAYSQAAALSNSSWLAKKESADLLRAAADITGLSLLTGCSNTTLFHFLVPHLPPIESSPDGPTWSLHIELWGSFLVQALVLTRARSVALYGAAMVASVVMIGGNALILFLIGHAAALLVRSSAVASLSTRSHSTVLLATAALACGILLAEHGELRGIYTLERVSMLTSLFRPYAWFQWHKEVAAVLVFGAVLMLAPLQSALRGRLLLSLGKLSFSIYLLHVPVLMTVGALIYIAARPMGAAAGGAVAFITVCGVTALLAVAFERFIDRPAITLSRSVRHRSMGATAPTHQQV